MKFNEIACKSLLSKSDNKFKSGESNLKEGRIDSAVGDLYYSAFQSVCALMVLLGKSTSKHTAVRAFVSRELGLTGLINLDLSKMYNKLMDMRHDADYSTDISFTEENVIPLINQVMEFNAAIKELINKEGLLNG